MTIYMQSILTNEVLKAEVSKEPKIDKDNILQMWKKVRIRLDNVPITLFYESSRGKRMFFYLDMKWYSVNLYEYMEKVDMFMQAKENQFTEITMQTYKMMPQSQKETIKKHNTKIRATKKKNEKKLKKAGRML